MNLNINKYLSVQSNNIENKKQKKISKGWFTQNIFAVKNARCKSV